MGLDMYLSKVRWVDGVRLYELDPNTVRDSDPELWRKIGRYCRRVDKTFPFPNWKTFEAQYAYWRKANHIHRWFVENVQGGEDDCGKYEVSEHDMACLLEACEKVMNRGVKPSSVLPTTDGFYFGNAEYDDGYYADIDYTISVCRRALSTFDYDKYVLVYHSSW